jgi:hypothetical protein
MASDCVSNVLALEIPKDGSPAVAEEFERTDP